MSQKVQIVFDAKMDVANLKSGLQQFQTGLASLSMPKNMGAELEKRLNRLNSEIRNFESLSEKAGNSLDSAGKINSSYGKIVEYARQLEITFKKIGEEAGIDASKFFPKEIITKIEGAEKAMEGYKQAVADGLKGLKDQVNEAKKLEQVLDKAKKDLSGAKKTQGLKEQKLTGAKTRQAQTNAEVLERQGKIDARKKEINARTEAINKEIEAINKRKKALQDEENTAKNNLKTLQDKSNTSVKQETKDKYAPLIKEQTKAWNEAKQAKDNYINSHSTKQLESELESLNAEVKSLETAEKGLTQEQNSAARAVSNAQNAYDTATDEVIYYENELKKAEQASTSFNTALENQKRAVESSALKTLISELQKIGIAVDPAVTDLQDIEKTLNQLQPQALNQIEKALEKAGTSLKDFNIDLDRLGTKNSALKQTADDAMKMSNQFNDLKNQVQYFFSLTNSVQLLQRAVRSAFETVKELDAAMTETAVVTDFSVGDMWDQLPRYTQAANELGTTTKGAYETMTLFYQQGLDTNEAFAIGTETMKMARIAGLDYANATNLMTAALRGFNMELNETSATRINDVYSELAAITAADTQEIATAMTKTASIAANANMEFETTAALLSQIIETTREPAETAGTAMKTIIARFTEMKKAASDVINVDGEEVNVNKVEAALKSAGVALRDTKGEFRDLDDVFLELSSKWNNLDMMTQRYVATMAAGSRQQSRFIAMMSDYDRTLELVDAAYNSSGASQRQFEKTQDSLESKLNKLTNAWNEFLMGISNSSVIKGAVDLLTGILNVVNKVTGAFGEGAGGVLKLGAAMASLKVGSIVLNKGLQKAASLAMSFQKDKGKSNSNFVQGLTQKINNFTNGKAFVIDTDINTKGIENKINNIKTQWSDLKSSLTKKVEIKGDPSKAILSFTTLDGAMAASAITSEVTSETIEVGLSEVGTKAILTAQGIDESSDEITEFGVEGSVALEILNKKYDELIAKSKMLNTESKDKTRASGIRELAKKEKNKVDDEIFQISGDISELTKQAEDVGAKTKNAFLNQIKQTGSKAGTLITTGLSKFAGLFGASGAAAGAAIAGGIIASITTVAATVYAIWYNSAEQAAKRIAETDAATLQRTQEEVDILKTKVEDLDNAWESLTSHKDTMDGLIQETSEWKTELNAANAEIQELLSKYPELYQYLQIDKQTGQWSLEEQGYKKYQEQVSNSLIDTQNKQYFQEMIAATSQSKYEALTKNKNSNKIVDWWANEDEINNLYLQTLRKAYEVAHDYQKNGAYLSTEQLISDTKTRDYITNMSNEDAKIFDLNMGYAGGGDPRAALEYYESIAKANLIAKQKSDAYVKSYMASSGASELIQTAVAETYSRNDNLNLYNQIEKDRKDRNYNGGTGGTGLTMQGKGTADEPTVESIMKQQGYKLIDETRNIYKNEATGQYVNVDKVGNADSTETSTRKIEGEKVEVLQWSDEYVRDLGRGESVRAQSITDMETLSQAYAANENLAKVVAGDLSAKVDNASNWKDIINENDKVLLDTDIAVRDFEIARSNSMEKLNAKYGAFRSNKIKTITDAVGQEKEIKIYSDKMYEAAQATIQFENSVSGLGAGTSQILTSTFLALKDLEEPNAGLITSLDQLGTSGDDSLDQIANQSAELANSLRDSGVSAQGLQDFVNKIDMSSPINGARQLKRALEEGGAAAAYAGAMIASDSIGNNFYSVGNQFKELISNEGWADTQKALTEIYNLTGDISADNIRELAEENTDLASILDTNSLKASGFAEMMKAVENGTISLTDVTSDLIKIYDGLYYSADLAGEAIARLEKAEIGESDTKIGNIYSESWGAVQDLVDRGAYGDSQIDDYMNQMVGEATWTNALAIAGGDKTEALKTIDQTYGLSANQGNLYGSWTTQLGRLNGQVANGAISIGADGTLNYDLSKVGSTQELIEKMVSEMGITEDYAETMLADMKTYSKSFGSDLDDLDKRGTLDSFLDSRTTKDGILNISKSEKAAFAKSRGQTVEDFEKDMKATGKIEDFEDRKYSDNGYYYTTKDETTGENKVQFTDDAAKQQIKDKITQATTEMNQQKVDMMIDVKGGEGQELNQEYLNKLLQIDEIREIVLDPNLSDEQKTALLEEITGDITGASANGLAEGLLGEESKANAAGYADYLGVQMYNSLGGYLTEAINLLANYKIQIPISFGLPITIPDNGLTQALGVAGKTFSIGGTNGMLTIGGDTFFGTASITTSGGGGFTPKTSNYSPQTVDVDAEDGGEGGKGDSYEKEHDKKNDPTADDKGGGSEDEFDPDNWAAYNEDQRLAALDRKRATNDREAELISKLPAEIQGPLQLMNLGEDMMYEAQEIQINKNKLEALQLERNNLEAEHSGVLNSGAIYYDEQLQSYMYNNDIMKGLDTESQKKAQEAMSALSEVSNKINEVSDQLDGGKIQAFIRSFEKGAKGVSKVLKEEKKTATNVNKAFDLLEKKLGLSEDAFDDFANGIAKTIDNSKVLNATFEGLDDEGDALIDNLEKSPLGKMLGESAKPVFDLLKNGGTNRQMGGALAAMGGDILEKLGDFANFDMLSMGLDGMNTMKGMMDQGKQMAEQAAQYICQAIQVVVDAITNREDILFNYLNLIEKELQNYEKLQRYSTQLEKGRLASSKEIALNWDAQWASLQKQLEMQEFRVEQRQQQLEMSRWIPFQLISGWDPTTDTLYENREVKFAWDLLIGFGQMMPMFGQVFGSLNQLYEDYDKRVTEAYEDRLEAEQAILDIQDERLELVKVGSEEATEFEEKILEALVQKEQEAIDELTSINESITDANSKLLSTLQDKLDKLRDQRENEKTEEELGEKERRLAYFRQATGQGKLMDIKTLEEELEEGHESYTDQLIDQRIADLEKQNELAAEQRQQQIDLLQAQLDWSEKYGIYWDQIYGMLYVINPDGTVSMNLDNFDLEGNLRANGELSKLLNTFSDNIGASIWSHLLENEELMRLGRYYQAFISRNGVTGEWGKYWALLDPGKDDPVNVTPDPWADRDVGALLGLILKIERAIASYFSMSDQGLVTGAGRLEQIVKNSLGKLFGIEDWANYKYEFSGAENLDTPISEWLWNINQNSNLNKPKSSSSNYESSNESAFQSGLGRLLGIGIKANSTTSIPSVVDKSQKSVTYEGGIHINIDGTKEPGGVIEELERFFTDLTSTDPTTL